MKHYVIVFSMFCFFTGCANDTKEIYEKFCWKLQEASWGKEMTNKDGK